MSSIEGPEIKRAIAEHISPKIINNEDHSWRISVYLDDFDYRIAQRGLTHGSQTTKLRVKRYYLLNKAEPHYDDICWLEVKSRAGSMVEKSRFTIPHSEVLSTLENGPTISTEPERRASQESFESVREGRKLRPLFIAHYCRWTFQDTRASLRITLDNNVSFHLPPKNIFTAQVPICSRAYLPPPLVAEHRWIMEIKSVGLTPKWVAKILGDHVPNDYSKFVSGVNAVAALGIIKK